MTKASLDGKVVAVTGATSGIGEAVAMGLAREGAHVAICGRRKAEGTGVIERLHTEGGKGLFVACDVSHATEVERFIAETVKAFGRLDAAVNCAGIGCPDTKLADISEKDFDEMIRINLRGVWLGMKYEIKQMLAQGGNGSIVNMGSILGHAVMGPPAQYSAGHYVAAKHGVEGLTKSAAVDYGRKGIRANTISPGIVATAMAEQVIQGDVPVVRNFIEQTALGRLASVDDVVGAVVFLVSDASRYATGTTIVVDGGYLTQ